MNDDDQEKLTPLLSVIVAAYNVEAFIERCLRSVLEQDSTRAIELIVVDDGSTDLTLSIIRSVVQGYPGARSMVIAQSNQGLSDARNVGVGCASCPYVAFLDGDDTWEHSFVRETLPIIIAGDADIIEFDAYIVDEGDQCIDRIKICPNDASGLHPVTRALLTRFARRFHTFAWARIYRKELVSDVRFPSRRHYEDAATVPFLFSIAKTIFYLNEPLICYRRRGGSITQSFKLKDVSDLCSSLDEAISVSKKCESNALYWSYIFRGLFRRACFVAARLQFSEIGRGEVIIYERLVQFSRAQGGTRWDCQRLWLYFFSIRIAALPYRVKQVIKTMVWRD